MEEEKEGLFESLKKIFNTPHHPQAFEFPPMSEETLKAYNEALAEWIAYEALKQGVVIKPRRYGYFQEQMKQIVKMPESEYQHLKAQFQFNEITPEDYDGNKLNINRIDWDMEYEQGLAPVSELWGRLKSSLNTDDPPMGKVMIISTLGDDQEFHKAIMEGAAVWNDKVSEELEPSDEFRNFFINYTSGRKYPDVHPIINIEEHLPEITDKEDPRPFHAKMGEKKGGSKNKKGGRRF